MSELSKVTCRKKICTWLHSSCLALNSWNGFYMDLDGKFWSMLSRSKYAVITNVQWSVMKQWNTLTIEHLYLWQSITKVLKYITLFHPPIKTNGTILSGLASIGRACTLSQVAVSCHCLRGCSGLTASIPEACSSMCFQKAIFNCQKAQPTSWTLIPVAGENRIGP